MSALRNRDTEIGIVDVLGGSGVYVFSGASLLHLNTLVRDRSSLRISFWEDLIVFGKRIPFVRFGRNSRRAVKRGWQTSR